MPTTDSVQIDDTNASSATTYSSAKIETVIGTSKAAQMTGATAYQDGKEGLATKPVAGDNQKALFGDGKYHNIYAANTGSVVVAVTDEPFCSMCVPRSSLSALCNKWVAVWLFVTA